MIREEGTGSSEEAAQAAEIARQAELDQVLREAVTDSELLALIAERGRAGEAFSTIGHRELPLIEKERKRLLLPSVRMPQLSLSDDGAVQLHDWDGGEAVIQARLVPIRDGFAHFGRGLGRHVIPEGLGPYRHLIDPTDSTAFVVTNGDFVVSEGVLLGAHYATKFGRITPDFLRERIASGKAHLRGLTRTQ
jgi:hypothetical protein